MAGPVMTLKPDELAMFEGQPRGFPFGEFRIEDVMLPEGDDMGIASEDDDIEEEAIEQETGFENAVVVDGLPVVGPEKLDKLVTILKKLFSNEKLGEIRPGGFCMPQDGETNMTKGYAFIEYFDQETARRVIDAINGYAMDKKHTLNVCSYNDFDKYSRVPDVYAPPEAKQFEAEQGLLAWQTDTRGRDQFLMRVGDDSEIYWNDAQRCMPDLVYKRSVWTESFLQWSPLGSYIATMHTKGVALWGGNDFKRLKRVVHEGVRLIEFSPCEKFLVSYSTQDPVNPRDVVMVILNVFDLRSGKKLREFRGRVDEYAVGSAAAAGGVLKWPVFKWAGGCNDKYFARLGRGFISIFETPECVLLEKKSVKLEGVTDFSWSPADPILCAFQTEQANGNQPARVSLIRAPDKKELRQKNLFSVSDVVLHWHPQGLYLAVRVDHYTKTKKSTFTSFELFSIKEKDIPMEVMEMPNKTDKVFDFAWEPKGHRFAVLHGEGPARPNVSFFSMRDLKGSVRGVVPLGTLQQRPCNQLLWSPQGKNILLAGLKALNGQLTFFNVDEFEVMKAAEHFLATDAEWDATGRYVATSVNALHTLMENGFVMWTFNGQDLYRRQRERLQQFSWRPRPASLLSAEQEKEIMRNLKKYSKRYDEEDATLGQEEDVKLKQEREKLMQEWDSWYERKRSFLDELEAAKQALLGARYKEDEFTISEIEITGTLEVKQEPYKP